MPNNEVNEDDGNGKKRAIIIGAVVGSLFALVTGAVAAAVVTLTAEQLGEGFATVSPCDSAFNVGATAPSWDDTAGSFVVSSVEVSNVNAPCVGEAIRVEVLNASGNSISSGGGVVTGSSFTLALTNGVDVNTIDAYAAVIYAP